MIRNQSESVGLRVPSMRSATSSIQLRITWPRHLSLMGLLLFTLLYVLIPAVAAQEPQRDPAGTATGDKHQAVNAAGNPFVVAEPTDKTAPDYDLCRSLTAVRFQLREPIFVTSRRVNDKTVATR